MPKTANRKLTEKYAWLKQGDELTEAFIEKQTKENQEICNQLNRRTEFRVTKTTFGLLDKDGKLIKDALKAAKKENTADENYMIEE